MHKPHWVNLECSKKYLKENYDKFIDLLELIKRVYSCKKRSPLTEVAAPSLHDTIADLFV